MSAMLGEQWANQEPRGRDWWPTDQWGRRGRGQARRKLESMSPNVYFPASARVAVRPYIRSEVAVRGGRSYLPGSRSVGINS